MTALMGVLSAVPLVAAGAGCVAGRWSARREVAAARRAALLDPLTGLANRAGLAAELDRRSGGQGPFVVLLVDLDGFKQVNDAHGHAAGDTVLCEVGRRLAGLVAGADGLAGRLGGDEFVVVGDAPAPVLGRLLGRDVVAAVGRPVAVGGQLLHVGASVGVVTGWPGDDPAALLAAADTAMYAAKTGGGSVAEFDSLAAPAPAPSASASGRRPGARLRDLTALGRAVTR